MSTTSAACAAADREQRPATNTEKKRRNIARRELPLSPGMPRAFARFIVELACISIATPGFPGECDAEFHRASHTPPPHELHAISFDLPRSDSRTCTFLFGSGDSVFNSELNESSMDRALLGVQGKARGSPRAQCAGKAPHTWSVSISRSAATLPRPTRGVEPFGARTSRHARMRMRADSR